ncbi:FAD/NAD(P)-binding protein, partial [Actinoallomurus acaciae]
MPAVAIVGGGASGIRAAAHLLRRATGSGVPLRVALIDRD